MRWDGRGDDHQEQADHGRGQESIDAPGGGSLARDEPVQQQEQGQGQADDPDQLEEAASGVIRVAQGGGLVASAEQVRQLQRDEGGEQEHKQAQDDR